MKKVLLIALVASGFAFASAQRSNAGVAIGIGLPIPFVYPVGYGYGYGCGYPYGYSAYRPFYRPVVYGGPGFYWSHGHRVYYARNRHWRR